MFNGFVSDGKKLLPSMELAKPVMEKLCAESENRQNGSARYHCAYLLGIAYQSKAPDPALDVLGDWLFDTTGKLYLGVSISINAVGTETKGVSGAEGVKEGDSRTMAVQALRLVGRERVMQRQRIVDQLRALEKDPKTTDDLRKAIKDLRAKFGI
jgi:hypothetical protein